MQDYSSPRPSPSLTCPLGASGPPGRLSPALTWSPSWFSFDQLTIPMATGWCCLCQAASAAPFCCTCSLSLATWLRSRPSTQRAPVFQPAARRQRQKVPKGGSVPASLLSPSTLLTCLSVCLPACRTGPCQDPPGVPGDHPQLQGLLAAGTWRSYLLPSVLPPPGGEGAPGKRGHHIWSGDNRGIDRAPSSDHLPGHCHT